MPKILQAKWVRWTAIAVAVVGLYALLGFQVAPRIVKSQAVSFVKKEYGRDLGIGVVRINPFLLQLEINDLSMPDADGKPMAGFRRLFVDFELSSIWHRAYVFKDLILEAPDLRAIIRPGGALNLADLAPKEPAPKEQKPSELPSLWLKSLAVSDGVIGFSDRARAKPFERRFSPVTFTLKDFRTTPEGGGFQLAAKSESGEGFDWKGRFEVAPRLASRGELRDPRTQGPRHQRVPRRRLAVRNGFGRDRPRWPLRRRHGRVARAQKSACRRSASPAWGCVPAAPTRTGSRCPASSSPTRPWRCPRRRLDRRTSRSRT